MSFSGAAILCRGSSRLFSRLGFACKPCSSKTIGFSGSSLLSGQTLHPRVSSSLAQSLSRPLRPSTLRALGAAAHCEAIAAAVPSPSAAAAAAAAASAAAGCRFLSSGSSSSETAAASGSKGTAAAAGEGSGEAAGTEGEGVEQRTAADASPDPPGAEDIEALKAELSASREALAAANAKVRELQDKLLRALAEQENARVRLSKEVASARDYAMSGFAKALLDVGDSLAFAREQLQQQVQKQKQQQQQQQQQQHTDLQQFLDGISLTENLFHKTLDRFGVQQYDPMGEKFDPSVHEALFEMEGPSEKEGHVAQVVQRGYKIKERILRAAKVGVVKGQ